MNIKEKFLELTKRTYPHGTEEELFNLLPKKLKTDEFGNKSALKYSVPIAFASASSRVSR